MRDLVYYVASSLDGFLADEQGDFSVFPQHPETLHDLFERYPETCPAHLRQALGISAEPRRFDAVIMGRRTYQPALDAGLTHGAYPHLKQHVVTHDAQLAQPPIQVCSGDVATFVEALKTEKGNDIWLCGGGHLAAQLVHLIDEIQVKVNPVLLGRGIPLLPTGAGPITTRLAASEELPGGVVLNTYRRDIRG